jgi:hypothetical protein
VPSAEIRTSPTFANGLQYDLAFERKLVQAVRRRLAGLLSELEKMKQISEGKLSGQTDR